MWQFSPLVSFSFHDFLLQVLDDLTQVSPVFQKLLFAMPQTNFETIFFLSVNIERPNL